MRTTIEGATGWVELTRGGLSLLAQGDEALRDRLDAALEAAPEDDPVDVVTDELSVGGVRRAPAFAIFDETAHRLVVRGTATARLEGPTGVREANGPARGPWSDEDVDPAVERVTLGTGEASAQQPAGLAAAPDGHAATDDELQEDGGGEDRGAPGRAAAGVADEAVASSAGSAGPQFVDGHLVGVLVAADEPEPQVADAAADAARDGDAEGDRSPERPGQEEAADAGDLPVAAASGVAASGAAAAGAPVVEEPDAPARESDTGELPVGAMVLAVSCAAGHLNPPDAGRCRVCRAEVPEQRAELAPRPALGVLHLSTGEEVTLDRSVRLGRAPRQADEGDEQAHLVRVSSPENEISRNHAEVVLDGWRVLVRDLGSTNGTTVTPPGAGPQRIRAGQEVGLEPGGTITLADRVSVVLEVAG